MEHILSRIADAKVAADQESLTLSVAAGDEVVTLHMNWRLAGELIDTLAARNDEIMAARAPQAAGMQAAAFRTCHTIDVAVDATNTMMLVTFDRDKPHRVGVAIPLTVAQAAGRRIEQLAKRSQKVGRKQKRQ
jgi:hypothetical protein